MLVSEATLCRAVKRLGYSLGYTRKMIGGSKRTGRVVEGSLEDLGCRVAGESIPAGSYSRLPRLGATAPKGAVASRRGQRCRYSDGKPEYQPRTTQRGGTREGPASYVLLALLSLG